MSDVSVRMTLVDDVSAKMQKIASSARTASTQISSTGKAIDNAFRSSAAESFASQAGEAINSVESDAEALGEALDEALSEMSSASAGEAVSAVSQLGESLEELTQKTETYVDANGRLRDASGKFVKGAQEESEGLEGLGDSAQGAGESMEQASSKAINFGSALQKLFAVVSAAVVLDKLKDFTTESIQLGEDFTSMMSEVEAISGASETEIAQMEQTAREYGATTVFSASDAAEALKYMSLAGWDAQQSTSALGGVLNLAAASGMELGQASDMVTDYLSAFGMEASQSTYFADMLAYAQSNSNTTAEQLGEAYRNSAANLHAAGQDVETTTSLLEAMANQGYKGSEAGTALAAAMRDITNGMEDGAIMIGDTSVAVQDSNGNFRDLTDILTDVESATDGMGDAQKAAALGATFTSDSIKALNMILAEGMDTVSGYEEELRNAGGTSESMANTMTDNLSGDIANLESAREELQLQIFEAMEEPLREATQYITDDTIPILTEWLPEAFGSAASSIEKVGSALSPLIETVLKNPEAVGDAFTSIAAGFVAMKTVSTGFKIASLVSEAGGLTSALGKLGTKLFGSPWVAGAAAVAAAVTAIGLAVKEYNEMQIEGSLEEHFGNVELDDSQIEDFASRVIDAEWLVNINAALGYFENAESLTEEAEEALADNDALEWKARVGIELTEDEQSSYMTNIETFTSDIEESLSEQTLAAKLVVEEFDITTSDGTSLGSKIAEWAESDMQEVSSLSSGLTNLVQTALTDGIIDVDEQAAIDALQGKISNIMSGWQEAEAQAEMDMLTQKYGRLSGADLEVGTFTSLVEELTEQRETATEALEESEKQLYTTLNALNREDENGVQRITDTELEDYKQQAGYAARNSEASMLANSVDFERNTLDDTYGEKLEENYANMAAGASSTIKAANEYFNNDEAYNAFLRLEQGATSAMEYASKWSPFSDNDQVALQDVYQAMQPDVSAMSDLIDEYVAMGQAIPQDVMDSFNDAMMVGAAAGDADAAWQVFANQMVADPANDALVQAIQDGTLAAPEELQTAIDRATAETTSEPITIEGMQANLEDIEVSQEHVQELIDDAMGTAFEGLEATGESITTDGGEVALEYKVTAAQTPEELAAEVGTTVEELLSVNAGMEEETTIEKDAKIYIPENAVEVDASAVGEAADEAVQSEAGGETTVSKTANVETQEGTVDESGAAAVGEAAEEAAQSEAGGETTATTTVNTTYVEGESDTSQVTAANEEVQSQTAEATVTVNTTAEEGTDNFSTVASAFASKFQSALTSAFNKTFTATTNASITVNYNIANPSKTISFSGGGSGTATVYAHAEGGIFDTPHYGVFAEAGSEAYIPIDGSENAKNIWMETGERLGMMDDGPIQIAPSGTSGGNGSSSGQEEKSTSSRTVDININGSGRITAGGGLSKEDIVDVLMEKVRDVFVNIVDEEALVGGDASYEY